MIKPDPNILDDIARAAGGAVNMVSGAQQQIRDEIKARIEDMADRADLVPRQDLDEALDMVAKLRADLEKLEDRVQALEKKAAPAKAKKTTSKSSAGKKKKTKKS